MNETLFLKMLHLKLFISHSLNFKNDINNIITFISKALQMMIETSMLLSKDCSRSMIN